VNLPNKTVKLKEMEQKYFKSKNNWADGGIKAVEWIANSNTKFKFFEFLSNK
jgi:hypothetical protein